MVIKIVLVATTSVAVAIFKYQNASLEEWKETCVAAIAVLTHQVGYSNFAWVYHRSTLLLKERRLC